MKLLQVADLLHGSIPLTSFEKNVLSTQVFNRLHNVLQNSTAYLTYPSGRHSRLSHSLGCLHIAGDIFHSSIANASPEQRLRFTKDARHELRQLMAEESFRSDLDRFLESRKVNPLIDSPEMKNFEESVLRRHAFEWQSVMKLGRKGKSRKNPTEEETSEEGSGLPATAMFVMMYQAIRLVALLHDLGHPPFSHIVEAALNDLYADIKIKPTKSLSKREKRFLDIMSGFQDRHAKIHEDIGNHLAAHVLSEALRDYRCDAVEILRSIIIKHLTLGILEEKTTFFKSLHSIVDGDLDADRLDYVLRDALVTGFGDGSFQYERLLRSFQLVYAHDSDPAPLFLPSVQALSGIEDFFHRRLSLYTFVIHHHRVVKTDGLLREAVRGLARDYLREKRGDGVRRQGYEIPSDISGLWITLDIDTHFTGSEYVRHYIQWDDAWLLAVLRRHFLQMEAREEVRGKSPDVMRRSVLSVQLEELLSNKKHYHSLFKRPESFLPLDDAFISALGRDFDFSPFERRKNEILARLPPEKQDRAEVNHLYKRVMKYHEKWFEAENYDEDDCRAERARLRDRNGFFVSDILYLVDALGEGGGQILDFVRLAGDDLKKSCGFDDIFIVEKPLKIGIKGDFRLVRDDGIVELRDVSQIVGELERRSLYFPRFFVYIYKGGGISMQEIEAWRREFAALMAVRFKELTGKLQKIQTEA